MMSVRDRHKKAVDDFLDTQQKTIRRNGEKVLRRWSRKELAEKSTDELRRMEHFIKHGKEDV